MASSATEMYDAMLSRGGIGRATGAAPSVTGVRPLLRVLPVVKGAVPAANATVAWPVTAITMVAMEFSPDAATHASSTEVGAYVKAAKVAAHVGAAEATDVAAAEATDVAAAEAADVAAAEATDVAAAEAAATATRLRIASKQAAGERGSHQDRHCPSQHGIFLCLRRVIRHMSELPIGPFPTDTDRSS
jgi:hypothetical protein